MNEGAMPRRMQGIEMCPCGADLLVHDTREGKVHVLNATAASVLSLCDGEHDIAAIVTAIAAEFSADTAVVSRDVARVLGIFRERRLLESLDDAEEVRGTVAS